MDGLTRSLALLRERVAGVAEALGTFESTWDPTVAKTHEGHQRWLVTGTGASEGPARWFVEALATTGRSARYMPLSCFAVGDPLATSDALAVFSQGLCPNARLALRAHSKPTVLFTSTPPEREQPLGASPITRVVLPPKSENDLLLRVAGPAVATAASDWFARALDGEPPGRQIATYTMRLADGSRHRAPIRERFEIGSVAAPSKTWTYRPWPFVAVPDKHPEKPPRAARPRAMAWARAAGVLDLDIDGFWLWAWANPSPEVEIESVTVEAADRSFALGGITAALVDEVPFPLPPARPVLIETEPAGDTASVDVETDRGTAGYPHPIAEADPDRSPGWGPAGDPVSPTARSPRWEPPRCGWRPPALGAAPSGGRT